MFKWLGNFVDSQDKELTRLRKTVVAVNGEIETLLTAQLDALAALREDLHTLLLAQPAAGRALPALLGAAADESTAAVEALTAEAAGLRRVIEVGEATTRKLNVLLADSRQLSQLAQELARRSGDRAEVEANIADLSDRITEQLRAFSRRPPRDRGRCGAPADPGQARPQGPQPGRDWPTWWMPPPPPWGRRSPTISAACKTCSMACATPRRCWRCWAIRSLAGGEAATAPRGPHPLDGLRAERPPSPGDLGDSARRHPRPGGRPAGQRPDEALAAPGSLLPAELQAAPGPLPSAAVAQQRGAAGCLAAARSRAPVPLTPQQGIAARHGARAQRRPGRPAHLAGSAPPMLALSVAAGRAAPDRGARAGAGRLAALQRPLRQPRRPPASPHGRGARPTSARPHRPLADLRGAVWRRSSRRSLTPFLEALAALRCPAGRRCWPRSTPRKPPGGTRRSPSSRSTSAS